MSLAINAPKKKRSRGRGRKIQGLSPYVAPPPVSAPLATSMPVPAAQPAVFSSTDARPQYRQAALRGLQPPQSGAEEHPSSPAREKQRKLPPSKPGQGDLRDRLSRGHWQMSQGGSKASSQAESKGAKPKDRGGVGRSGGSQSSSHHKRTNQGHQQSSSKSGPPRPASSATATSGTLAATSGKACGGASGHSGNSKRQPEE